MAGSLIRILPRTDFVATAVGTTAQEVPLGDFDARIFNSMTLIGRIHAKSASGGSNQTVNIYLRNLAPTPEDTSSEYPSTTSIATATFTMNGGTTGAQTPQIVAASGAMSYKVRAFLAYSQSVAGTAFTFSLSVDGLGRE